MRLRVKTPKGNIVAGTTLQLESTLGDLKAVLKEYGSHLTLKNGYPPKTITNSDTDTLATCGIKDGDSLVLQVSSSGASAPVQEPRASTKDRVPLSSGGDLVVREMKDDNSCLFRSIAYLFLRDAEHCSFLRKVICDAIIDDPISYNEAILGKSPFEYCEWIMKSDSWGGAIELSIFSKHFQTEICSVDVSTSRMDRFGEGQYAQRAFVMYSGIHYDALVVSAQGLPADFDACVFEGEQADFVSIAALELAQIWKKLHKFTDLANFTLKCGICKVGLTGQKDAQAHAMNTGHTQFTEYTS